MSRKRKTFPTLRETLVRAAQKLDKADLVYGHGTTNAEDEAVFLVGEGLGLSPAKFERGLDKPLKAMQLLRVDQLVNLRIRTRRPAPYLVGRAYIQGVPFRVTENTIVPRSFIGELLFTDHFHDSFIGKRKIGRVLDVCTGTGCLAILAAMMFRRALVDAVDISTEALKIAKLNVKDHKLGQRVRLHKGSLFAPVKTRKYDLIITNPPYVSAASMRALPPEYKHEPKLALAGGKDGLDLVRKILKAAPKHLTDNGAIICEIGAGRAILEKEYPHLPFFWLDTALSEGEVFWLTKADFQKRRRPQK